MTEKEALKRRLLSYLDIKAEREQIQAELDALADPRGANLDGMPKGSGNGDAMLGVIAQREKLADKYRAKLEELIPQMDQRLTYLSSEDLNEYYLMLEYVEQPSNG